MVLLVLYSVLGFTRGEAALEEEDRETVYKNTKP